MIRVRFSVPYPPFREYVKTPRWFDLPGPTTILDLIMILDRDYWESVGTNRSGKESVFMDAKIWSLMQMLWNPETGKFYEDVGIEARTAAPESEMIPIDTDVQINIPSESWIVLTPDAGC